MENVSLKDTKVVRSPRDTILDGIVLAVQKGTWKEILDSNNVSEENQAKFDDLEDMRLVVTFETSFEGLNIKGDTNVRYYETPTDNSMMGKMINKYGALEPGTQVKVEFNEKGVGNIRV